MFVDIRIGRVHNLYVVYSVFQLKNLLAAQVDSL